jgi:hypothetical protein
MFIYTSICVYVHTCLYTNIYIPAPNSLSFSTRVWKSPVHTLQVKEWGLRSEGYMWLCIFVHEYICMYTCIYIHEHIYGKTYVYMHVCMYLCILTVSHFQLECENLRYISYGLRSEGWGVRVEEWGLIIVMMILT